MTVVVVVGPGRTQRKRQFGRDVGHARRLRDVGKGAVAVVAHQVTAAVSGDVEIGPAVVVVVGDRDALPVSGVVFEPRADGDIGEGAVAVVAIEHILGGEVLFCGREGAGHRAALGSEDVEQAVLIVVQKSHTAAGSLYVEMPSGRSHLIAPVQSCGLGDIGKADGMAGERGSGLGFGRVQDAQAGLGLMQGGSG